MVNLEDAIIARMKSHGQNFEILVDCDKAISFKEGKAIEIRDVLAVERIFKDAKKGDVAAEASLRQVFNTDDVLEVASQIIKKGEIQLTAEYRNNLREQKHRSIVEAIHKRGIDPRSGLPHPVARIENAFEEARIHIDEFAPAEQQIEAIVQKLRPILPIRFETRQLELTIPAHYAGKCYSIIRQHSKPLKEQWQNNGDLLTLVEIEAGAQEEFFSKLNNITRGDITTRVVK